MIQPTNVFKDNLTQLPTIDGIERTNLVDDQGAMVADIENKPGKQGSVAVYHYPQQTLDQLDATVVEHGLAIFAEHTTDTHNRPGAHPSVDRLLAIAAGEPALRIDIVKVRRHIVEARCQQQVNHPFSRCTAHNSIQRTGRRAH